jgi:hypothetical protein
VVQLGEHQAGRGAPPRALRRPVPQGRADPGRCARVLADARARARDRLRRRRARLLTYVRIDVPMLRRHADGTTSVYQHTEVWSKADRPLPMWEHDGPAEHTDRGTGRSPCATRRSRPSGSTSSPSCTRSSRISAKIAAWARIVPALDKIDEANRQATRLSQMLFRHNNVTNALERTAWMRMAGRCRRRARERHGWYCRLGAGTITLGDDTFAHAAEA